MKHFSRINNRDRILSFHNKTIKYIYSRCNDRWDFYTSKIITYKVFIYLQFADGV